ncbi:FtsX-like permease family protein [Haematospirillum jordaniae]|uniref:Cell division protein n=1 Tax=Haematospirillum jordaniae TaxID=1549855 RepID=A0A143DDM3_9PROT|nr:FtsX-like permease family protein [Haematospirillum jordaniae]AMW34228.1 hypothetical protein AY555_02460 [Haematospirillum jordaniae]NKD45070.1 FtsX-like permease family protein [Haematospirillum jordaniae]NKD57111.1 FtsX-like permease family protein [Haematospirillum jordaniae]NKD59344.1 FtsX-like permease family protein [Haematospirillum jordaniae]NKD67037.1 FtsX-like permease family protein [Haematospirillum jordaniae]
MIAGWFRTDLPVATDPAGHFLPWLVAIMTFLAAMALTGALTLSSLSARWESTMTGTLTIQIPAMAADTGPGSATHKRIDHIARSLEALPGVQRAEPIPAEHVATLLEPWLGAGNLARELPLPHLIDVLLDEGSGSDLAVLEKHLQAIAPGTTIDDHRVWLSRLIKASVILRLLAWIMLSLVVGATTATVVHATRASLAVHRPQIEVMHLVGATDSYIAGQFARRTCMHAVAGSLLGLVLAWPALWGVRSILSNIDGGLIPETSVDALHVVALCSLPFLAAGLSVLTTRITVRRQLAHML